MAEKTEDDQANAYRWTCPKDGKCDKECSCHGKIEPVGKNRKKGDFEGRRRKARQPARGKHGRD